MFFLTLIVKIQPLVLVIQIFRRVRFAELSQVQCQNFQCNILKTILQLEETFFDLAVGEEKKNVLVVCDRGTMDPSACE